MLDLGFVRVTVAGDGQLDLHGGVLIQGQPLLLGSQNSHASARAHGDGGGDVVVEEELLEHGAVRPIHLHQLLHPVVEPGKPLGKGHARLGLHHAEIHGGADAAVGVDHAVAQQRIAGVNP